MLYVCDFSIPIESKEGHPSFNKIHVRVILLHLAGMHFAILYVLHRDTGAKQV